MSTISEAIHAAVTLHQSGDLAQAEQIYRDVLKADAGHPDAWHLLGLVFFQRGDLEKASEYIRRAIQLDGGQAVFHNNLGHVYRARRQWSEAEASCRQALRLKPDLADAHNNLGAVLNDQGRFADAIVCYRQAIALKPDSAQTLGNLAGALRDQGRQEDAIEVYRQALTVDPQMLTALYDLGTLLLSRSQWDEAMRCYQRALAIKPDYAEAHCNLGCAFKEQRQYAQAVESYRRALRYRGDLAEAHFNLGVILQDQGQMAAAADCYRNAIRGKNDYAHAHNNLGTLLKLQGNLTEAIEHFERAAQSDPRFAEPHFNLGNAYAKLHRFDLAESSYRRAIELNPRYADTHNNFGNLLLLQDRCDEALVYYEAAIRCRDDFAQAHRNRSLVWLKLGNFVQGWPESEWRWRLPDASPQLFTQPRWEGQPFAGRTILLVAEQGLGDTIQFVRFAPLIKSRGGRVLLTCPENSHALVGTAPGVDRLVPADAGGENVDYYCPLLSLPGVLGTVVETIPSDIPYLFAEQQRIAHWREAMGHGGDFKVGITWQGNPDYVDDAYRSIPLEHFAPLADCPGVKLFSLQKGYGHEQMAIWADKLSIDDLGSSLDNGANAFVETAAVMKNLDLVIAPDTATAHLAGALGVPVWVALSLKSDWRWLREREDSPWYPTARLFRQSRLGDWAELMARIAVELRALASSSR
ncbi:MAG: tetratricopeptide repeat protein [Planctomycetia bacterium]|nr:tetratricopeptide repeat protein [Planctomycetia bacterium]